MEPPPWTGRLGGMAAPVRLLARLAAVAALAALAVACGGTASSPGGSPSGSPSGPPAPTEVTVDSPEAAAALVAERSPVLEGIGPIDPDLIGQAHWWQATPLDADAGDGWRIVFRVGWGDCPAGCIDEHTWTYDVDREGTVAFVGEAGPAVPQAILDELRAGGSRTGVAGRVTAGPTCPVENPNDPACAPRAVAGAVLIVKGAGGTEVGRLVTDGSGFFRLALQPGDYTLEPQPVEGLMGTPAATAFTVADGDETVLDVAYDTGIR